MRLRVPMWRRALLALGVLHLGLQLFSWFPKHWEFDDDNRDLFIYHATAQRVLQDRSIYTPQPNYGPEQVPTTFLYPPAFAALIAPLGHLTLPAFSRLWFSLLIVAFWVYAATLAHLVTRRATLQSTLIAGFVLAAWPGTMIGMSLGNAQPMLHALWGISLACGAAASGIAACGVALAASALIKIHPLWPLMVAWKADRASILPSLCVLLTGTLLGTFVCGVQSHWEWWQYAQPIVAQGSFAPSNFSLSFLALRAAQLLGWQYESGPLPGLARAYLTSVTLLAPLIALWLVRHEKPLLQMSVVGVVVVVFAPLCWDNYLPMLLAPLALWLRGILDDSEATDNTSAL
ncbi:MAG: alpha,2-mannosyltransferase [Abditibacteriota bacterium]|nr:alpha,2-mannosyltransferase [Abditibacteriota bacterium]